MSGSITNSQQKRLAQLNEEYDAVTKALGYTTNPVEEVRLNRRLDELERQITALEQGKRGAPDSLPDPTGKIGESRVRQPIWPALLVLVFILVVIGVSVWQPWRSVPTPTSSATVTPIPPTATPIATSTQALATTPTVASTPPPTCSPIIKTNGTGGWTTMSGNPATIKAFDEVKGAGNRQAIELSYGMKTPNDFVAVRKDIAPVDLARGAITGSNGVTLLYKGSGVSVTGELVLFLRDSNDEVSCVARWDISAGDSWQSFTALYGDFTCLLGSSIQCLALCDHLPEQLDKVFSVQLAISNKKGIQGEGAVAFDQVCGLR